MVWLQRSSMGLPPLWWVCDDQEYSCPWPVCTYDSSKSCGSKVKSGQTKLKSAGNMRRCNSAEWCQGNSRFNWGPWIRIITSTNTPEGPDEMTIMTAERSRWLRCQSAELPQSPLLWQHGSDAGSLLGELNKILFVVLLGNVKRSKCCHLLDAFTNEYSALRNHLYFFLKRILRFCNFF